MKTEQATMFGVTPKPEPDAKLSAGRRLTQRKNNLIARGLHPATGRPLAGNGETCGGCANLDDRSPYFKCSLVKATNGPATDVRKSWPACDKWGLL